MWSHGGCGRMVGVVAWWVWSSLGWVGRRGLTVRANSSNVPIIKHKEQEKSEF